MLVRVTLPLAIDPSLGWQRVTEARGGNRRLAGTRSGLDAELAGPDGAARLLGNAAFVSLAATALGWWMRPGTTAAGGVLHVLAASLAYLGGPTLAVQWSHRWLPANTPVEDAAGFAAAAVVPVALAGAFNVVPSLFLSFALAIAGAVLSVRTAWCGANAMLALEGQARIRAAAAPASLAVSVALLATSIRWVLPS